MCTLIAIHRVVPQRWLVVAANRDEFLDRPAEGPRVREGAVAGTGPVVAPMDMRAGGTWLGVNRQGVFSALTNLRNPDPDATRVSRGQVVMDSLGAANALEAAEVVNAIPGGTHNPFNLLVADRERAFLVVYGEKTTLKELSPGVHVIGNGDPLKTQEPKLERLQDRVESALSAEGKDIFGSLAGLCKQHEDGSLEDVCVHVGNRYGTRSSILMGLDESFGREAGGITEGKVGHSYAGNRLLYADGPPCVSPYEDRSFLLNELRRMPGYGSAEL